MSTKSIIHVSHILIILWLIYFAISLSWNWWVETIIIYKVFLQIWLSHLFINSFPFHKSCYFLKSHFVRIIFITYIWLLMRIPWILQCFISYAFSFIILLSNFLSQILWRLLFCIELKTILNGLLKHLKSLINVIIIN